MQHSGQIDWKAIFAPKSLALTLVGVACALVALKGFMIPNHFLDGGVTGISILAHEVFHIDISPVLIGLNLPFLIIGYRKIGKTFAVQGFIAILLLAVAIHYIEVPTVTKDKILIAVFGGMMMGLAIGLVIRAGSVIDGFEVVAHYTDKKSAFKSSEIVLFTNTLIFLGAATFFGIEPAMYSILTYFTAIQTSNYIVDGFEEFISLTVVSKEDELVKSIIVKDYKKAISVYKGRRGYLPQSFDVHYDCDIVVTIVTRLEVFRIQESIKAVDPNAFFFVQRINEVKGGVGKHTARH